MFFNKFYITVICFITFFIIVLYIYKYKKIIFYYDKYQNLRKSKNIYIKNNRFRHDKIKKHVNTENCKISPFSSSLIIVQLQSFTNKPYTGYELYQAILTANLKFGENNIFHYYDSHIKNNILFSLAPGTSIGKFSMDNIGAFKYDKLILFSKLFSQPQININNNFNLMIAIAKQLTEELGGEIYDEFNQLLNNDIMKNYHKKFTLSSNSIIKNVVNM